MLSYGSEERLKILLLEVGEGERVLELTRQRLCAISDFSLRSAFERVDRDGSNFVGGRELVDFCRDNAALHVTGEDAFELIKFFDGAALGRLTFDDFTQMFLPCEDNVLRNITLDRPSVRIGRFQMLPKDIESVMTDVIVKEVDLARKLDLLKRDLKACLDYSEMASFRSIDRHNTGVISTVNLGAFYREHGHFASEAELMATIRRLDTDGVANISFADWTEFLRPLTVPPPLPVRPPAPLPPPAPIPPPAPYYSRYDDWRYYSRWYNWRYSDYKYGTPDPWYWPYSRYYSRYVSPYWRSPLRELSPDPYLRSPSPIPETKTVTYDVERPTRYSPARTVKRETYHSPYRPPRTYTSYL